MQKLLSMSFMVESRFGIILQEIKIISKMYRNGCCPMWWVIIGIVV